MKRKVLFLIAVSATYKNCYGNYDNITDIEEIHLKDVIVTKKYKLLRLGGMLLFSITLGLFLANYFLNEETQKGWGLFGGSFGPSMIYTCLLINSGWDISINMVTKILSIIASLVFGVLILIGFKNHNNDFLQFSGNNYENPLTWLIGVLLLLNPIPLIALTHLYEKGR